MDAAAVWERRSLAAMAAAVWVSFLLDPADALRLALWNGSAAGDDVGVALDAAVAACDELLVIDGGDEPLASASAAAASTVHSRRPAMAPVPKRDVRCGSS